MIELTSIIQSDRVLSRGEMAKIALRLSGPAILAQISSIAMQYIDAAMVGQLGATSSASIGLVSAAVWMMGGVTNAFSYGFSVQVAQGLGAGEEKRVRKVVHQGIFSLLILSLLIGILGVLIAGRLPYWLGGSGEMAREAKGYFLTYASFLPLVQMMYFGGAVLQASGDMKTPSILESLMCVEDVILNALLIFPAGANADRSFVPAPLEIGAGLGVTGAALGTCLAYLITAFAMWYCILFRSDPLHWRKEKKPFEKSILTRALQIGSPMAFEEVALTGAQLVSTMIVAPLGTIAVSAHSFAITAESICYMPGYGLEGAASTLVGQAYGAGKKKLARSFGWMTILLGMGIMAVAGGAMYFLCPWVFRFLTPVKAVQKLGVRVLRIELMAEALFGASIVSAGALRGAGDTFVPALMSLFSMWGVRLTLASILSKSLGLRGVWTAMAIELSFRGVIFLIRFARSKYLKDN
jgi:putative MATE family efflux protein